MLLWNAESQQRIPIGPEVRSRAFSVLTVTSMAHTAVSTRHRNFLHSFVPIFKALEQQSNIIWTSHTEKTAVGGEYGNELFSTNIRILLQSVDFNALHIARCWKLHYRLIQIFRNLFPEVDAIERNSAIIQC